MADVLSRSALWLALSCTALAGCGAQFDPPTEVKSLRIMGVQKDKPYAVPGETVSLTMFWHDGSPKVDPNDPTARSVEIGWFGPCINPPYDSYAACGAALAKQQANDDPSDDLVTGSGERFALTIPDRSDLLHPSQDPKQPEYAVIYVFFAACAGKLGPSQDPSFPAGCYAPDDTGFARPLGSDDFVAGYSGIYVFGPEHGYRNQNPVIQGWVTQGDFQNDPSMVCLGDECLGSCDDPAGGELFGECHNASPIIDTGNPEVVPHVGGAGAVAVSDTWSEFPGATISIYKINPPGFTHASDAILFPHPVPALHAQKDIFAFAENGLAYLSFIDQTYSQTSVPEPGTLGLLGIGLLGLAGYSRRRLRQH